MADIKTILEKLEGLQTEIDNIYQMVSSLEKPIIPDVITTEPVPEEPVVITREPIKRALVVGINKYDPSLGCDLNGCVNDASNIYMRLGESFGFKASDTKLILDYSATQKNILEGLEWLVTDTVEGDQLVFTFSGHGSQVPDYNGDELDGFDEIICPTDLDWDNPFTDDILASYFKRVPSGVQLTFICDSCNSGTIAKGISIVPSVDSSKGERTVRALQCPQVMQALSEGLEIKNVRKFGVKAFVNTPDQNHILLAGCAEDDYSSEGYFYGEVHGALTFNFCEILRENKNRTWKNVEEVVTRRVKQTWGFSQTPQLVTKPENLDKMVFV